MFTQSPEENLRALALNPMNSSKELDLNIGKWTNEENLKYAIFMDFHKQKLASRQKKKDFKVFEEMSKFIGSRNTVQCRSHHQKLEQRFKNFKKIISAVKNQMGRKQYKAQFKKWTNNGQSLVIEQPKIKENVDLSQFSTKKELIKEEVVEPQQVQVKNQEFVGTEAIYPLLAFQNFYNPFSYPLQNLYSFPTPYY